MMHVFLNLIVVEAAIALLVFLWVMLRRRFSVATLAQAAAAVAAWIEVVVLAGNGHPTRGTHWLAILVIACAGPATYRRYRDQRP
jgi:hypothetical protein